MLDVALQVAPTKLSVLIAGESGVGKEIIPRVIHDNSPRRREKYFAINCGSIPEGTIDSELFGHVKGSYTGAINDSPGYFGTANKGTLFLDEVGELPLATQARLLRVLENGEYIPVGATEVKKTDVRIVAATNVNIQKAISEGRFREDLFYRLNEVPMKMPPLRERGEDIVLLFRLFAMQMAEEYRMDKVVLTDEAKQVLMRYKWPGNIRQLKNITRQISVLSPERTITADMLRTFIPQDQETTELATIHRSDSGDHSFENEREILYKILFELRGNVNEMRHEMSQLKKRLDEAQSQPLSAPAASTQLAPITPISPMSPITSPAAVDAMAEEYIEPEKEPENLNLNDLGKTMLEKALERKGPRAQPRQPPQGRAGTGHQRPHPLPPSETVRAGHHPDAVLADTHVVLRQLQVQRRQHRLLEDEDHPDRRLPPPCLIQLGTHGTDVQQRAPQPVLRPHTSGTREA